MKNIGKHPKITTVLFSSCILLLLVFPLKVPFNRYDEGFAVFNAMRVMSGDVPYRDFWVIYPPGQFYVLATIFKMFGASLLIARMYDIVVRLVVVIAVYLIGRKVASHTLACFSCAVTALLLSASGFYAYAVFPSLALSLLSILCLLKYVETERRGWFVLAGIAVGISSIFRLDITLYACISTITTFFLFNLYPVTQANRGRVGRFLIASKSVIWLLGGIIAVALPAYGYLSLKSGISPLWSQLVVFPTTTLHEVRWKPYPGLIPNLSPLAAKAVAFSVAYNEFLYWLRFYLPLATYGIAFLVIARSFHRRQGVADTKLLGTTAVTVLGMLLFAQALSRYDYLHILPTSIVAFLVIISLVHGTGNFSTIARSAIPLLGLGTLAVLYSLQPIQQMVDVGRKYSPLDCHSRLERAGCVYVRPEQEKAVEFIRAHTQEHEPIFVGNDRHDLLYVNDIGFYFLADRPSPTRYHELYPGVVNTLPVQKTIVEDIVAANVTWIVTVNMPKSKEPNASAISSGVSYLDNFIQSNYTLVAKFGHYKIWRRTP